MDENSVKELTQSFQMDSQKKNCKYRYVILLLCTTATLLEYATRTNINNAIVSMVSTLPGNETIKSDFCSIPTAKNSSAPKTVYIDETFAWDPTTQGAILGAFFYGYIVLQIPSGRLSEMFGGKWIVVIGIASSATINVLTPFIASSVPLLIASRFLLGVLQGGVYPACFSLIVAWMSKDEKAFGFGIVNVGGNLGAVTASTVTGYMSQHFGWKSSFYAIGGVSLMWTVLWITLVKSSPDKKKEEGEEKLKSPVEASSKKYGSCNYAFEGDQSDEKETCESESVSSTSSGSCVSSSPGAETSSSILKIPWLRILTNKAVIACICVRFGASFAYLTLQTKLPAYLNDILHVEPGVNGVLNSMLYISVSVSMAFGSYLSEVVIKRHWLSRTNTRKTFTGIALFGTSLCFCLVPSTNCNEILAMVLLIGGITLYGLTSGGDMIVPAEMSKKYPSTIYALINMCANFAGMIAPMLIGAILGQATDGHELKAKWDLVFYIVAIIVATTALIFVLFAKAEFQEGIDCYYDEPPKLETTCHTPSATTLDSKPTLVERMTSNESTRSRTSTDLNLLP